MLLLYTQKLKSVTALLILCIICMQTEEQKVGRPGNKTIVYIQDVIMQPLCIVVIVVIMQEGKLSSMQVAGKRKVGVGSLGVQGFIQACKLAGGDESLGW